MRADIRLALLGDATIQHVLSKAGKQPAVIAATSGADGDLGDAVLPRPHLILRWGSLSPGIGPVNRKDLTVWAHDEPGDYGDIETLLNRVRAVLTDMVAKPLSNGGWLTCVEWQGDSEDGYDDGPGTITRNGTYIITGSGG